MAIVVTKEEKILREKRHKQFVYLLDKYKVRTRKLALLTGIEENNLSSYKSGKQPITEHTMERIMRGFEMLDQELLINKPNVEVEDWDYVLQQLKLHGNVVIKKNKIKDIDKYMVDLKLNGLTCTYSTDRDGDYVVTDSNQHKPMVEKVIQAPKPVIESDPSIIAKVRNLHADSIVLHGEALKCVETTEQILNEVTKELEEVEPVEEIIITDEDIKEVTQSNSKTYEMNDEAREYFKHLSEQEEEELKELADEQLAKCGLSKESKEESFINFLKDRFTHEEIKGFIRGITILSVLDEDYQKASYFIDYFINNGYVPEEMRL